MKLTKLSVLVLGASTLASLVIIAPKEVSAASDTMTVSDASGSGESQYPLQFGRPFIEGEIPDYPQVILDGTPVETQADVKNRYPDGSVKFAIISVVVPSIPANGSVSVGFRDQRTSNNAPLTKAEMLSSDYDFDAQMKLASGSSTLVADARKMLEDGSYAYWTQGPVATTILLADDSAQGAYDLGFDSYRPFRPRFYVTFWPATHQVRVRYVGEDVKLRSLENLRYDLTLTLGESNPQVVYAQPAVDQSFGTRWTKVYWLGDTPNPQVTIDYDVAYLASTKYFPNYDTSYKPSDSVLASVYSSWQKSAHEKIDDPGVWTTGMGTTGDRGDLGLETLWNTDWTYTGDWRMRQESLNLADLASAGWPMNFREDDPTKKIDRGQSMSGLGLPMSAYAYPDLWFPTNIGYYKYSIDRRPSALARGWQQDGAHQPDPFYAPYILTGDYFYLEGLQFWAAAGATWDCPGTQAWCKGPLGVNGIRDQVRGDAWLFRTRTNAAFATPDNETALKTYFNQLVDDAIAVWEGKMGIADGHFAGSAGYDWGKSVVGGYFWDSPLHWYGCYSDAGSKGCGIADWMQGYFMMALGWAKERGFPDDKLVSWLAYNYTSRFADPNYNPFGMLGLYYVHVRAPDGTYYATWADIMKNTYAAKPGAKSFSGIVDDYPPIFAGAASYAASAPGGGNMWNWVEANIRAPDYQGYFHGKDQRWNIIPREGSDAAPLPPPTSDGVSPTPPPASGGAPATPPPAHAGGATRNSGPVIGPGWAPGTTLAAAPAMQSTMLERLWHLIAGWLARTWRLLRTSLKNTGLAKG